MAITLVLLSHAWGPRNPPDMGRLQPLFLQGSLGVRVFFVLSGFLITRLLLGEHTTTGTISLKNFYARRALRIFPVYYLYLLFLAILWSLGLYTDAASSWAGALTFTRNIVGRGPSATGHFWSLAVEEQFYVLWPAAIVLFHLSSRWRTAVGLLAAVIAMSFLARLVACPGHSFLCQRVLGVQSAVRYADSLAVGCLLAILDARGKIRRASPAANTVLLSGCTLALIVSAIPWTYGSRLADSTVLSLQAFMVGGAIYTSTRARSTALSFRVLNWRPVVYLGLVSYSLYVWHMPFLSGAMGAMMANLALYDVPLWWLPALLLASGSYYLYERPIASLKKRFRAPGLEAHA